jgi:hypothetical protein
MSDLFVGEILIFFLLLPVMLRPFFRRLQRIEGCALLPFLAFLLCVAVIAAFGLQITFLPVLFFCLLVFLSGLARLFRLFRHLPTDWYSPVAKVYGVFLLLLFVSVLWLSFAFAPEAAFFSGKNVQRVFSTQTVSGGIKARVTTWSPPVAGTNAEKNPIVLFVGDVSSGATGRRTAASILAENGYTVVAADFSGSRDYENPLLASSTLRTFLFRFSRVFSISLAPANGKTVRFAQTREVDRLVEIAKGRYGSDAVFYVVAEGSACDAVLSLRSARPDLFGGVFCILPSDAVVSVSGRDSIMKAVDSGAMPANAGSFPVFVLTGGPETLYGFGELAADDPLAAAQCGVSRDLDRKQAEITARRAASWFTMRRAYDNR